MSCITSINFIIHLNGHKYRSFEGGRRLNQGDPLFPLLFVLITEYLSRLLQQVSNRPRFKFHPSCSKLQWTHLMSANDLMIFTKVDPHTLKQVIGAFIVFKRCFGHHANLGKSYEGCFELLISNYNMVLGLNPRTLPFRSLGDPIIASKLSKVEYKSLVDKITMRVKY